MTTWSNTSKNSAAFTPPSKNATTFDDGVDFMLKEDLAFLLLENGGKIVLDQSTNAKHNPIFSNPSKN